MLDPTDQRQYPGGMPPYPPTTGYPPNASPYPPMPTGYPAPAYPPPGNYGGELKLFYGVLNMLKNIELILMKFF